MAPGKYGLNENWSLCLLTVIACVCCFIFAASFSRHKSLPVGNYHHCFHRSQRLWVPSIQKWSASCCIYCVDSALFNWLIDYIKFVHSASKVLIRCYWLIDLVSSFMINLLFDNFTVHQFLSACYIYLGISYRML